jgi:hypothetical protein
VKGKRAGLKKGKRNRQRSGSMHRGVRCRRQEKGRHAVGELSLAILGENLLKSRQRYRNSVEIRSINITSGNSNQM